MIKTVHCSLVAFLFLVVSQSASANNYTTPGTGVKWSLDQLVANSGGDVTFAGGAYNINDTITISLNDTLLITTDATVKFAGNTFLEVNGVLTINPPTGVLFTAQNTTTRYLGVRINTNGSVLKKMTFEYANSLRLFDCNPIIEDCIFRLNSPVTTFGNAAISLFRSNPVITNCQFIDNQRAAIQGGANIANAPVIRNCIFRGNNTLNQNVPQINLGASGTDTVKIINNQFLRASTNSGAIGFLPVGNVQAVITGNLIRNNRYGITLNGGANIYSLISYNVIDSNNIQGDPLLGGSGIAFSGGSASSQQKSIVTGNVFRFNLWGITIQGRSKPNLGNITNTDTSDNGKNQFINNTNTSTPGIDVYNNSPDPISAQNNYWGTNNVSLIEGKIFHTPDQASLGLVDYSSYILLPMAFTNLVATPYTRNVVLSWGTMYELNSSYFVIERSLDGTAFDSLAKVNASGTTYGLTNYSYADMTIPFYNRPIYYRVKIVNTNGTFLYSNIANATVIVSKEPPVRVYPTRVRNSQPWTVVIVSDKEQTATVELFDGGGRKLAQHSQALVNATNLFTFTPPATTPAGMLFIRVTVDGITKTVEVFKQN